MRHAFRTPQQPYGVAPVIVAAVIGAAVAVTQIAAQVASSNSAKQRALREQVPCIAKIDGQIAQLKADKTPGRQKKIKALLKQRRVYAKDPAKCPGVKNLAAARAAGAEADAEVAAAEGMAAQAAGVPMSALAEPEGTPTWVWIAVAVGGAAVIGGAVYAAKGKR
jgi:hypothetical protein